ncbi:MAG: ABC transporter substrate-binding protein [Deltaproteobacteria bacterium]|nr:ABC transporter substrate-binding protein [Deltaproteobacteria bacterium]
MAAGAAGLLGACWNMPPLYCAEPSSNLRVGYLPITDAAPLLIAHALGYFQDEGLKVKRPVMVRSWSALLESFLSGKFNVTHMLLPIPVWMRFKHKIPVKVLAWDHVNGSAVTVARNSGIRGFADLGGKQIAVPFWYSMHNIVLQMGLRSADLEPVIQAQAAPLGPRQVNLFVLSPPEMPAALAGRKIDGYVVAEPFNALGELKIGARIMRFTGDIWKNHPCCVVVMNESATRTRPVFTQKAINAIVRAQGWTSHNLAEAAKLLSRDGMGYLPVSREVLLRVFTGYRPSRYAQGPVPHAIHHPRWQVARIGFQPYPYPSATRLIIQAMGRTRMEGDTAFLEALNAETAARDLVDDRFVKKAILDMGGPQRFAPVDLKHPWEREEVIEV